jgi:hypothetical protein
VVNEYQEGKLTDGFKKTAVWGWFLIFLSEPGFFGFDGFFG